MLKDRVSVEAQLGNLKGSDATLASPALLQPRGECLDLTTCKSGCSGSLQTHGFVLSESHLCRGRRCLTKSRGAAPLGILVVPSKVGKWLFQLRGFPQKGDGRCVLRTMARLPGCRHRVSTRTAPRPSSPDSCDATPILSARSSAWPWAFRRAMWPLQLRRMTRSTHELLALSKARCAPSDLLKALPYAWAALGTKPRSVDSAILPGTLYWHSGGKGHSHWHQEGASRCGRSLWHRPKLELPRGSAESQDAHSLNPAEPGEGLVASSLHVMHTRCTPTPTR